MASELFAHGWKVTGTPIDAGTPAAQGSVPGTGSMWVRTMGANGVRTIRPWLEGHRYAHRRRNACTTWAPAEKRDRTPQAVRMRIASAPVANGWKGRGRHSDGALDHMNPLAKLRASSLGGAGAIPAPFCWSTRLLAASAARGSLGMATAAVANGGAAAINAWLAGASTR